MKEKQKTQMQNNNISSLVRDSKFLICAIHAGLEPVTGQIAASISGGMHSCYIDNRFLKTHINSTEYTTPELEKILANVETVISIHGELTRSTKFVIVGGLDTERSQAIKNALFDAGYEVSGPVHGLSGVDVANICNRGKTGRGVQLELSLGFRNMLRQNSREFAKFTQTVGLGLL